MTELHYITPMVNVPSILHLGILSHRRVSTVEHNSVAMQEIQDRRENKRVPRGKLLHDYANLYFTARNPMLRKLKSKHLGLCVLRVDPEVLDIPGTVITDQNAASGYAAFAPAPEGLGIVDANLTFAQWWTDPDYYAYWRKKRAKCAEVLVPDRVDPELILGAYVSCHDARNSINAIVSGLEVDIDLKLFFF